MHHLTPATHVPWTVASPFRMMPGLSRLGAEPAPALFVRDALAPAYAAAKRAVLADPQRAPLGDTEPAVLRAIAAAYRQQTGVDVPPDAVSLSASLQEDFVVLHDGAEGFRARLLAVCFPSNWNPAEKQGMDFAAIHAPVADNALLQGGARGIMDLAFRQAPMLRHVWLLTPDGALAQHPETRRTRWDEALAAAGDHGRLVDQLFFRVERQTTLPLPALRAGVFFIRVLVAPLADVLAASPGRGHELHAALSSMSDAVLAYRGMTAVRPRLLAELRA